MPEHITKNVIHLTLNFVDMQGEKECRFFIIKQVHVKSINVTIKHVTVGIQRIEDMDTSANFRQNAYIITKRTIKKGQRNTEKKLK